MNKTRKSSTAIARPDPAIREGQLTNIGVIATHPAQVPDLSQHDIETWKRFETGSLSGPDKTTWFTMTEDLLHSFDTLAILLRHELMRQSWLNTYLLAAGMNQIVEDYLHSDLQMLVRGANYLEQISTPFGWLLAKSIRSSVKFWSMMRGKRQGIRNIVTWQKELADFLDELAQLLMDIEPKGEENLKKLVAEGGNLMAYVPKFPISLRQSFTKIPSCFRSFDQQPVDLQRIVDEFSNHWPDYNRLITVVGIRTSGSFLAPLYGAILKASGYKNVGVLTLRPGTQLTQSEENSIRELVRENGLALLCDDPPVTGSALSNTARILEQAGIAYKNIVLLLQLFGDYDSLPGKVQKYPSVLLSWPNWSIQRQLELSQVKQVLADACDSSFQISELERLPYLGDLEKRDHVRALYRVGLLNGDTNQAISCLVQVEGVGLGYFGEHALAVAQKLPAYAAKIITLNDGLLFQEVPVQAQILDSTLLVKEEKWIDHLVNYVLVRNRQLPVTEDTSIKLNGRNTVWEVASNILSGAFGRGWFLARMPLIDAYVKKLLKASQPSIIDGDMSLHHWFIQEKPDRHLIKTHISDKDFSHLDLYCYDPVYDLANLAVETDPTIHSSVIRRTYEISANTKVVPESWMLYQLVHLWNRGRQDPEKSKAISRRMAQVLQRYYAEIYFHDLEVVGEGCICAIDIDGILENRQFGFPSISPASAKSLRALNKHGYRVILATGRSLQDVQERCAAYKLNGGVAEYGAVLYDQISGEVKPLLTEDEQRALHKIRNKLSNKHGIYLDNDYRFAVRAYCQVENGGQIKLDKETIEQVLLETDTEEMVYVIQGKAQSDFMVRRIDKGVGIKEWMACFNPASVNSSENSKNTPILALAVGDSAPDLPMFALASLAFAPANASWEVKHAEIPITNYPYQRGFEQAVTKQLGHTPCSCPECRNNPLPYASSFMQDILAVQENGFLGMFWQAIKLFVRNGVRINVRPQ